jgi:hypothetical protein
MKYMLKTVLEYVDGENKSNTMCTKAEFCDIIIFAVGHYSLLHREQSQYQPERKLKYD